MRRGVYISVMAVLIGLWASGCATTELKEEVHVPKVKYQLAKASGASEKEVLYGVLKEVEDVKLSFRLAGPVSSIALKEGQRVRKGQVLARMDVRDYQLQYRATKAEYDQVKGEVSRLKAMHRSHNLSDNDFEKAVAGEKQMKVKLDAAKNALKDVIITAPFNGVVQKVFVSSGEMVNAGMPIISLVNTSALKVQVSVPFATILEKEHFTSSYCKSSYYPEKRFPLEYIGSTMKPEANKLYAMWFYLERSSDYPLVSGMNVQVTLCSDRMASNKVVVPMNACIHDQHDCYLYCYEDGKAVKHKVELVSVDPIGDATVRGIAPQDTVITAGLKALRDGMNVSLLK
ncbi:efflux RND transporter periplasmic adaptor subunit [Halosquirtibacter xylanolyticus]|uniref:efflux RND transporter periplasmic adaptor subunit n=1 Tax=Halosquirtibacter xylanolyticus TaxID=3374599 RepID=UPI00374A0058|nr:efflux RND transporter periplasmic adaptor subunit [Prolixibacteraceae bacterium]